MKRIVLAFCLLAASAQAQSTAPLPKGTALPPPQPVAETWLPRPIAELSALDKITARSSTIFIKVGETAVFGSLHIALRSCMSRAPDQPVDHAAFLNVTDHNLPDFNFSSWMLVSDPAVAVLEHPIYDVKLISCHTS